MSDRDQINANYRPPGLRMTQPPTPYLEINGYSPAPPVDAGSSATVLLIVLLVVGGLILLLLVGSCVIGRRKKRSPAGNIESAGHPRVDKAPTGVASKIQQFQAPSPTPHPSLMQSNLDSKKSSPRPSPDYALLPSHISYEVLYTASHRFSNDKLLGKGGFGFVYKGVLPCGKEVAIKRLKPGSKQGEREFRAEVEIISRVHHKHLVSLVGYCVDGDKRMLVYEFIPNLTLDIHLHGKERPFMNWPTRMKIALGTARGLKYLHEDCHPKIIHRDIKAANILLDDNFDAKVADFGLAKFSPDTDIPVDTRLVGTFGYMAPEYAANGELTIKSDVFSFGVVLWELITGRQPVYKTQSSDNDVNLVNWAKPYLKKALKKSDYAAGLVDQRLLNDNDYNSREMSVMAACALACVRGSARRRPKMSVMVRALEGHLSLDELNKEIKIKHSWALVLDRAGVNKS